MQTKIKLAVGALALSGAGLTFITLHEGTVHKAYLDPVGIPTVCVGHTGPDVKLGKTYTQAVCDDLLRQDTQAAQYAVRSAVRVPITQAQYDALVSFTFNVGGGNLRSSTLLRKINAGDCLGAKQEFHRWNRARGVVLPGLTKRRADEAALWGTGC